jgi:hypothetical protein
MGSCSDYGEDLATFTQPTQQAYGAPQPWVPELGISEREPDVHDYGTHTHGYMTTLPEFGWTFPVTQTQNNGFILPNGTLQDYNAAVSETGYFIGHVMLMQYKTLALMFL